ncbi:SMP-30/Gluconolaconase/LRE domain protein [Beutenbergia cavernae DSM 12333]|uniref:SMP-30/Gluconolaconase/LRE domain protein n=1 Tax=Beutenbergia cavernae (strain ATCC BAA-8 / DSM 12333 / CCUG 43141 / JCM 11478 / NBRC 16432 / NCIMB 13614 / HKI 0122) TaxID=471853 RepID=C5C545_BEUC1|nr:SMP-30/gluconolactonase/LRE family protein [Beutenbergia cavernae]ACQ82185.1 SMP-30/Gluconolaconase/LRE domain protein [Beutenbergia cavernae DSM 12333]
MRSRAEPLSRDTFRQGESPRVDPRTGELMWIDMRAGTFHTGVLEGGALVTTRTVHVGTRIGAAAPLAADGDGWVAASGRDLVHLRDDGHVDDAGGAVGSVRTVLAGITPADDRPLNDGVCAPDGAFWVGSQTLPRRPEGALYRIGPDLAVTEVLADVTVSNGIALDPSGAALFYVDTLPDRCLERFDVAGGVLSGRRTVAVCDGGNPDGIALDDDGCVWVAMWGAGEVRRIAPSGEVIDVVEVPVSRPSAVALWEGLLVITTARTDLDDPAPSGDEGRLFAAAVPVGAAPTPAFGATASTLRSTEEATPAWA